MRVAWLQDDPGYLGGAELTARELRAAAPDGVEIVDQPPGAPPAEADVAVVHNCMTYRPEDKPQGRVVRFVHDHRGPGPIDSEHRIFYSPLQREHLGLEGTCIPAPLNRERFAPSRQVRRNGKREGAVSIGTFGHPGKGGQLLREWSDANGPLHLYGAGPFKPQGPNLVQHDPVPFERVPTTLWGYRRFVHLPTEVEAYGRGVAEAWAAGCDLVINGNVGARYWIEENPGAIDTAASDFWEYVLNG